MPGGPARRRPGTTPCCLAPGATRRVRNHRFTAVALAYLVVVVSADLVFPRNAGILALLAVPPLLIACERGWKVTAAVCAAVLLLVVTNMFGYNVVPVSVLVLRVIGMLLATSCAIFVAVERVRREELLAHSRAAAAAAQQAIIPPVPERIGQYAFTSLYRSAAVESLVGGDFFKVVRSPWGTRFILGDVEGKGLAAVSMSALVLGCFREWAPRTPELAELVRILDERVHDYEERSAFVTAVVGSLHDDSTLELANCGHTFPLLFRGGATRTLAPSRTAVPLGLGPAPPCEVVELLAGDRLLCYTDGLVEARTPEGTFVALDDLVAGVGNEAADVALDTIAQRLAARATPRDDIAMLLVSVGPAEDDVDAAAAAQSIGVGSGEPGTGEPGAGSPGGAGGGTSIGGRSIGGTSGWSGAPGRGMAPGEPTAPVTASP